MTQLAPSNHVVLIFLRDGRACKASYPKSVIGSRGSIYVDSIEDDVFFGSHLVRENGITQHLPSKQGSVFRSQIAYMIEILDGKVTVHR